MQIKIQSITSVKVSSTSPVNIASGRARLYTDEEFYIAFNMFESTYRDEIINQIL